MSFRKSIETLSGAVKQVVNLGIEKPVLKSIFEPVPNEIHRLVMVEGFDRRDIIQDPKTQLIYVANNERNLLRLQSKFKTRHTRGETGIISPMVVVTKLDSSLEAVDLPLAEAELYIATNPDLSDTLTSEFGIKPLKGKPQKFKDLSLEVREAVTRYALGQRPSLHIQERLNKSGTPRGRIANVAEDAIIGVKTFAPIVASSTLKLDKALHEEFKVATIQIGGVAADSAKQLASKGLNILGDVGSELNEVSRQAIKVGDEKQVDFIAGVIAQLTVIGLGGNKKLKS